MKIATWNVNSLRIRLPQVEKWVDEHQPDIVCLQETKLIDEDFPVDTIKALGFDSAYAGQKSYNGVAILSKYEMSDIVTDLTGDDPQRRILGVTIKGIRVLNLYVPNGQAVGSEKFDYKLQWLDVLIDFSIEQLKQHQKMLVVGDFNIAPEDGDVHDPDAWGGQVLCNEAERAKFKQLLASGFHDTFRKFDQEPGIFSWWDYRAAAFQRNRGLRIDHILASDALVEKCTSSCIDKEPRAWERPSDHAPAVAEFSV